MGFGHGAWLTHGVNAAPLAGASGFAANTSSACVVGLRPIFS